MLNSFFGIDSIYDTPQVEHNDYKEKADIAEHIHLCWWGVWIVVITIDQSILATNI